MKQMGLPIIVFVLVMAMAGPVAAHRIVVFAWAENGQIHVEGSFGKDRPALSSAVVVRTPDGKEVLRGTTDQSGTCRFGIPPGTDSDLIVRLEAGTGHAGEWTIPLAELSVEMSQEQVAEKKAEKEAIEKNPSLLRILSGVLVIAGLAWGVALMKKRGGRA